MRRRDFTLIELMIVAAVIGVLAAIAVPKFAELVRKSKDADFGKVWVMCFHTDVKGSYWSDY